MADRICQTFGRQFTSEITGNLTATRIYFVFLDTPRDNLKDVIDDALAVGLPDLGDAYEIDSATGGLIAIKHTPKEIEKERGFYSIEVTYQTYTTSFATPTNRPWDISMSSEKIETFPLYSLWNTTAIFTGPQVFGTIASTPLFNSAGFPYGEPPRRIRTRPIVTLNKKFADYTDIGTIASITQLMQFIGTVNDAPITICGIYGAKAQWKMDDIQIKYVESDSETYYDVTFVVVYDEEYHIEKVLNAGWRDKNGEITFKGQDISSPWPIDAAGVRLSDALTPAARAAAAIFYAYGMLQLKDFSILSLPTTF